MIKPDHTEPPVRAGDIDGLGRVYSEFGGPILRPHEKVLHQRENCEAAIYGSWRLFFPKRLFDSLPGNPSGTIHVTSERVIFLREIDIWKEVKPLLTPLGLPTAAQKEARLKQLKARGARQYCVLSPSALKLIRLRRKPALFHARLLATDGAKYEFFVRTDKDDSGFFDLLEGAMSQGTGVSGRKG